jgi:hypothetical protein
VAEVIAQPGRFRLVQTPTASYSAKRRKSEAPAKPIAVAEGQPEEMEIGIGQRSKR